jgi:hypothetical protein
VPMSPAFTVTFCVSHVIVFLLARPIRLDALHVVLRGSAP